MIAELGLAALWLAASLALLQVLAGWAGWRLASEPLAALLRPVAIAQGLLVPALVRRVDLAVLYH